MLSHRVRHRLDLSGPGLQASTTTEGTFAPGLPVMPGTVLRTHGVAADPVLGDREEAAITTRFPEVQDTSLARLMTFSTTGGTCTPFQPAGNLTILHITIGNGTSFHLFQICGAKLPPMLGELGDGPFTPGLGGTTALIALIPVGPI